MRRWVLFGTTFAVTLAAAQTFEDSVYSSHQVIGSSMYPTLNDERRDQDRVLVQRFAYDGTCAARGDIVAAISPEARDDFVIKRIVGLPGDVVSLRHSSGFATVPEGQCWLEGDNKATSRDSESFGAVPLALVVGKATHRIRSFFPPDVAPLQADPSWTRLAHTEDEASLELVDPLLAALWQRQELDALLREAAEAQAEGEGEGANDGLGVGMEKGEGKIEEGAECETAAAESV